MKDFEYMVECMERDLIVMLMEKQGMTMTEAFDTFYNSETHEKLNDARALDSIFKARVMCIVF